MAMIIGDPIIAVTNTQVDSAISSTSVNPVQNKVIKEALDNKVDKVEGKGLSKNDFTDALKEKLDEIEEEAEKNVQSDWNQTDNTKDDFIKNKPTVDTALSGTSTNAVQNKAIKAAIDLKLDKEDYYMYDIDANKTYLVTRSFVNGFLVEHFEEVTA